MPVETASTTSEEPQSAGASQASEAVQEGEEQDRLRLAEQAATLSLQTPSKAKKDKKSWINSNSKKDLVTVGVDGVAAVNSTASVASKGAEVAMSAGATGKALEIAGNVGEILGYVGIGLQAFSLAENAVRLRDAKVRFGAFTKAYESLDENDPVRPYLVDAAKQQSWETKRRWARVAVTAATIAASSTALLVGAATTGGLVLAGVAAVLAVAKGAETIRNFFNKRAAKKLQRKIAEELLQEALESPNSSSAAEVTEMLVSLQIPVPTLGQDGKLNPKELGKAVKKLAPHLGRSEKAIEEGLAERADQIREGSDAEAEAALASE